MRTIITVDDVVKIDTSENYYTLGKTFTATLYFENNGKHEVWIKPFYELPFSGRSINDPEPNTDVILLDYPHADESAIPLPAKSKILYFERDYKPKFTGEFIISCLGVNKSVLILDPPSEGETVIAMMNKYSFKNTDDATLFITNIGLKRLSLVDPYEIQNKDGDLWVKVSPSDYRDVWLDILLELDSGGIFRQQVEIDRLEVGLYRISKEIYTDFPQEHFTLFVEFEIQESREKEYAWVTATVLTVDPSPTLNIIELSSEDSDIPRSLFKAINKALPEAESVQEGEQIRDVPTGERRLAISIAEAESIIHYFGEEKEKDRLYYEYYVSYVDSTFSILIQFHLPDPTS